MSVISKKGISYEEWVEERKKGLGGSDASVVLGLNRWKSRMALFLEKTGQIEPPFHLPGRGISLPDSQYRQGNCWRKRRA